MSKTKSRARRAAVSTPPAVPQTAFGLPSPQLERALLTGESRGLLEDYFGPEAYQQLRDLSRDAATRPVRGGPRVLILPGIMGSTLSRKLLAIEDILWINPVEIAIGKLTGLALGAGASPYHALGVVLLAYLKLKLRLRSAGFDADFFPFDWRRGFLELGANLAEALASEPAQHVSLVAHSMGGLVARAAMAKADGKVSRLIMLGTPNYGSFAPVQVLRGTYDVVLKIATVDLLHSAEQLCNRVFNTFPGLYQMLPSPDKFSGVNLYDADAWPKSGPRPRAALLSGVKPVVDALAPADERFFLIAGVNQDTVTGLRVEQGEFVYEISPDGDGTVPVEFARLANIPEEQVYYVEQGHGGMPNNGTVETAIIDLLSNGVTAALPRDRPAGKRGSRFVSEQQVREMARQARGVGQLGSADYRHLLDAVAAPPSRAQQPVAASASAAAASGVASGVGTTSLNQQFQNLVIGRKRQQRLELTLARGSITEVDARAYVLGIFRNVAPSGAAKAIDQRLDGAINEFTARRMFAGEMGEIFIIPAGHKRLGADLVLFAGLGAFDRFNADVQQLVAENVIRVLVRSRVDDFATVLIGAGSGQSTPAVLQNLLTGFFRGLRDADQLHRFRGITLCEADPARYSEMKAELFRLAGTSLFEDIEVTLDEIEVPAPAAAPRVLEAAEEPVYAIMRQEGQSGGQLHFRASILGSGMKAAVVSAARDVNARALAALLAKFDKAVGPGSTVTDVKPFGQEFADLMLPAEVCTVLESMKDRHIVVVHDAPASRVPWETLTVNGWSPSVTGGLSRRYLADNLPIATWLEQRRVAPSLSLLLVVNPLGDLPGAEDEGDRIAKLAAAIPAMQVKELRNDKATKAAILSALRAGKHDIVHYAGHAFFDEQAPARSGLVCAGREVLSGPDMMGISNLPFVIFFNACEAGRVRGKPAPAATPASDRIAQSSGVAEALMRGGIANYMSTYWPVNDQSAVGFATTFYQRILDGAPIGAALLEGRQAVLELGVRDWADYVLYGSFDFVLKRGG